LTNQGKFYFRGIREGIYLIGDIDKVKEVVRGKIDPKFKT